MHSDDRQVQGRTVGARRQCDEVLRRDAAGGQGIDVQLCLVQGDPLRGVVAQVLQGGEAAVLSEEGADLVGELVGGLGGGVSPRTWWR